MSAIESTTIRQQFPFYRQKNPPVYLDSAATAQVPDMVLNAMQRYYTSYKGNVHRGLHAQTGRATDAYEQARKKTQKFLNAKHSSEIIFTKNCTEAINLVVHCWAKRHLQKDDVVALSLLEHHSNIVPWLQLKEERGIRLRWFGEETTLDAALHEGNVRLVAITGQSNVLGICPDLPSIIQKSHAAGAKVLVDAAQLIVHHPIDVQKLDCDFLAFSGHKLYGPTGIGVLYAKQELQQEMTEWLGGGGMINDVHLDAFTSADIPAKFEGGTPPIAEAIGLAAAIDWLSQFSWKDIEAYEKEVMEYAIAQLSTIEGLKIIHYPLSTIHYQSGCLSFIIAGVHPHDLTDILGQKNIALRAGHHCAQPLHQHLGIPASTRLSLAIYNTKEEIDALRGGIVQAIEVLNA